MSKLFSSLPPVLGCSLAILLSSCASLPSFLQKKPLATADGVADEAKKTAADKAKDFVNPFPAGTYEHFKAEPTYKKTYNVYKNESVLAQTNSGNAKLNIDLSDQRAQLINSDAGLVVMDYPIASGKSGHETPTGNYTILEKIKDKRSNIYGRYVDKEGTTVVGDATNGKTEQPEGTTFLGASMPYWMRFTWDGIGHHIGNVPRYPASHGCVRGYKPVMPTIFSKVKTGTPVLIQD